MSMTNPERSVAALLNDECDCVVMDEALLDHALLRDGAGLRAEELFRAAPHLFSRSAVFVDARAATAMRDVVAAVERIVALPRYVEQALARAHPHARIPSPGQGACLGFDFHISARGPQLIEINTNAGGGLLNALLRRAQRPCCDAVREALREDPADHAALFFEMFEEEWRSARGARPLMTIAIVDDAPEQQYLFPEFRLFARLFEARGVRALIGDARELKRRAGGLWLGETRIDLVYNRVTDFMLELPEHAALREAYGADESVITPSPRAHALYADKRRLATLSDPNALCALGARPQDAALLAQHVPHTYVVAELDREALWRDRKELFFKPHSGYGSKAAYRGDKLTKGVFDQILRGGYVAQRLVPPSSRILCIGQERRELKLDIRCFAYRGRVQLMCARLYRGQTTNFRTEGGGFAPLFETRL